MVAPFIMNRPTRVFARLTFTGENKNCPPVRCDLSRVASIVPANPLPSNLGGAMPSEARAQMRCISKDEKLSVLCNDNQAVSIPPYSDDAKLGEGLNSPVADLAATPAVRNKIGCRGRKRTHNAGDVFESNSRPVKVVRTGVDAGASGLTAVAGEQRGRQEMHHVDALLSENEVLKQQNKILAQKVLAFQRILRSEANFELARQKLVELEASKSSASLVQG